MRVRLSRMHHPVTVLGHGRRVGIWFQGCSIGCRGCVSRDTWDPDGAEPVEVAEVLDAVRALPAGQVDGVTISGGEPFDQPEALAELVDGLRGWRDELAHPVDLLCYSGYTFPVLRRRFPELVERLDLLVTGPYLQDRPTDAPLRGSANQQLVRMSTLADERYPDAEPAPGAKRLQVQTAGGDLWLVGIPRPGDLESLRQRLADRGVRLTEVSWTT